MEQVLAHYCQDPWNLERCAHVGDWAGDKIICVGQYFESYPEGLFTEEDLETLKNKYTSRNGLDGLYQLVDEEEWPLPEKCRWEPDRYLELDGNWALRNLTKKVYVRLDGLEDGECGGVEQVLLSYISWSASNMCSMEYDLSQGEWAGNRFDITMLDDQMKEGRKDVTEKVVEYVKPIWDSETG